MNAPWTSPKRVHISSERDPFFAFLADAATADDVRPIVVELGWPQDKLYLGGLRNAVQTLSVSSSPKILLVDLAGSADPLTDIGSLAEVCEPGTIVLALGDVNDVRLYRELLASGIHDYVLKPVDPAILRDSFLQAQIAQHAPKVAEAETRPQRVVQVIGVRGGVGASSITSTLAWLSAEKTHVKTAILDLDLHFGVGALQFDVEPGRGLVDALENPARVDSLFVDRAIVKVNDRLAILSAEMPMSVSMIADGAALQHLQDELKNSFDAIFVDLPRTLAVQNPGLMAEATDFVVVTDLTLAATRDTIRLLGFLQNVGAAAKIWLVARQNGVATECEVSRKDFEASIERKIDMVLPFDSKAMTAAAREGKPVVVASKSTKLAQSLEQMFGMLMQMDGAEAAKSGPFDGLRKSLDGLLGKVGKNKTQKKS